jgi:hypothetical protein
MSGRDALALFAGLGSGYLNTQNQMRDQAYQDEQRAYQRELQGRERDAYNLAQDTRAKMAAAATPQDPVPVQAKADTADNIDVGTDPTATAPTGQYTSDGKTYANQGDAQAAVAAANTPSLQMARMASVAAASGDAATAASLNAQARQAELGDMQLSAAHRQDIAEKFNQDMNSKVHNFNDLADFVSTSNGDGQSGTLKVKAVPSADGTVVVMNKVNDDGSMTPLPNYTFPNSDLGLNSAKIGLLKGMTTEQQLVHLHQMNQEDVARQQANERARNDAALAAERANSTEARIEVARMRLEAERAMHPQRDPLEKLPGGVRVQYMDAAKQSEGIQAAITKARADGTWDDSKLTPGQQAMVTQAAVLEKRKNDILGKYGVGVGGSGADPLGFGDGTPAAAPPAAPRKPTTEIGRMLEAAPPGSWTNPNMPAPPPSTPAYETAGFRPPALAITNPAYAKMRDEAAQRAAKMRDEAAQRAANSLTAEQAYQALYGNAQRAQMTH